VKPLVRIRARADVDVHDDADDDAELESEPEVETDSDADRAADVDARARAIAVLARVCGKRAPLRERRADVAPRTRAPSRRAALNPPETARTPASRPICAACLAMAPISRILHGGSELARRLFFEVVGAVVALVVPLGKRAFASVGLSGEPALFDEAVSCSAFAPCTRSTDSMRAPRHARTLASPGSILHPTPREET
jgi:hypothetical protein